ncbi:MAG: YncE family protein [Gemmatimonadaceae bacterium]|nr:YncE family protein [Gemmatimonadaceae bacterium]
MSSNSKVIALATMLILATASLARAQKNPPPLTPTGPGQSPGSVTDGAIPVTSHDRVYVAEQFSNTVSVINPDDNTLLGVIRLGDPQPGNMSPLYKGELLVHGMGYSPDHTTLAVVSVGSNSVSFIETSNNSVKHVTYLGRSPHEAFFTPDGSEVWVTVRGEDYVAVLDGKTYAEKTRITVPPGPGMQIFSPDGKYGYVCSSFTPQLSIITVADHKIVATIKQESPFCPNIAATPDGRQVWFTLKDIGHTVVFDAHPPFKIQKILDTGPVTNHVNFANIPAGIFAYVTVGGLNQVQVFKTTDFSKVATIPVGKLPHGIWPSGDGSMMYVGLENSDALSVINTASNKVIATIPIGQAPQALAYVPNAVPSGSGKGNLQPLEDAGHAVHLSLGPPSNGKAKVADMGPTSVTIFDQGLTQIVQAAVTGLKPKTSYVLVLSTLQNGRGDLQSLASFTTNLAGAAIVNAVGPIRQLVQGESRNPRRYLVITTGTADQTGEVVQVQVQ